MYRSRMRSGFAVPVRPAWALALACCLVPSAWALKRIGYGDETAGHVQDQPAPTPQ